MLAMIVLPPGTDRLKVGEIPALVADAIHPPLPDDTPRLLSYLQKEAIDRDLVLQWCGQNGGFPVALTDADWEALYSGPWSALPRLELQPESTEGPTKLKTRITEGDWGRYREALEARPPQGWQLIAVWRNPAAEQWLMNHEARRQWAKLLQQQALRGFIEPWPSSSLIPTPGLVGRQLEESFLSVAKFAEFAAGFSVGVRVQRAFTRKPLARELLEILLKEPMDENVTVIEAIGSFYGQASKTVREWIPQLELVVERQAQGHFTVGEAAQLLADGNQSTDVKDMIARMGAAKVGNPERRLVRSPNLLPLPDHAEPREYLDLVTAVEVDEWLSGLGVMFRLASACPFLPAPERGQATASAVHQERAEERQDRRLARFTELGGRLKRVTGAWNVDNTLGRRGALAALVAEEKATLRARSDRKDVSLDLQAAADRQRASRAA